MESDTSSMRTSGGGNPMPYTPGNQNPGSGAMGTPTPTPQPSSFNIADMSAPSNIVPPKSPAPSNAGMNGNGGPKKGNKVFMWTIIGIVLVALIAAAYFFLYPGLSGLNSTSNTAPAPAATPEVIPTPTATTTPTSTDSGIIPEAIEVHASLFKTPPDLTSEIKPTIFTSTGVKSAIQVTSTTVPLFKELVIKTTDNKPISFSSFTAMFFPTFFTPDITLNFEPDYSLIAYTNAKGTWLGFAAKLKTSADIGYVQGLMNNFQKDPGIEGFYLSDPGAPFQWKDGKINNKPASVLDFSVRGGPEFGYAWADRYLIVGTDLEAATQIAKHLGY